MSAYLGDSFVVRTPQRCSVRKHSSVVILPPAFSENSEIVEHALVTALEASKDQGTDTRGTNGEVNPGKTFEEEDNMEGEKATNSFKHMAPRPWKPFEAEKTEVMVVQQSKTATAREAAGQEEVGRLPVEIDKVERESGSACKVIEEDEMDDAGLTNNGDCLNPFNYDNIASLDEMRIRKKSSKKKKAPQPPQRTSSLSESPAEGDEMKTESDVNDIEDQAIKKQDEQYNGKMEQDHSNKDEASQLEESLKEVEIKGMVESVKETQEKVGNREKEIDVENQTTITETVVTRTTRRLIDLTVRKSVIENIDEEDTLKELTEEAQHIPTDWNKEIPDEKDYGNQTELVLNVEKLAKAHEEVVTNDDLAKEVSKMKDKVKKQKRPVNLDIKQGWTDFIEGI